MVAHFEMRTGKDLKRIAPELRRMDNKQLKSEFGRELRAAAKPMVPAVKAAIREIPSKRPYTASGLRGRMTRAVKLEVRTTGRDAGVRIRVDGRKMPSGDKNLQSYMEGVKKPWRHPVYGNREVWVKQQPKPYFFKTVDRIGTSARRDVNKAMDRVAKKIS